MIIPYVTLPGTCREALAFYEAIFRVRSESVQSYGDYVPEGIDNPPEDLAKWILHAELTIQDSVIWLSDEPGNTQGEGNLMLVITVPGKETAQQIYQGLSQGGQITLPPVETFYSSFHAGVTDRFQVKWNIIAQTKE